MNVVQFLDIYLHIAPDQWCVNKNPIGGIKNLIYNT